MLHYEFIKRTDDKSLFNQIKGLVVCAQKSLERDLKKRREHLRELIDAEELVYENEFIVKIKSRVDESIRRRQDSLLALKQKRELEAKNFVARKKVQQTMTNCILIRDELRRQDYRETQLCQLEQMDDRLRAQVLEKKKDELWQKVQDRVTEDYDRKQKMEEDLQLGLTVEQCKVWAQQYKERKEKEAADIAHYRKPRPELQVEDKVLVDPKKKAEALIAARKDMAEVCQQQKEVAKEADNFVEVFHAETMRQVRREMEEALKKKPEVKAAVHDYLNYLTKFKQFVADQNKKCDELFDNMEEHYYCYKNRAKRVTQRKKRQVAEQCYKIMLKQVCEQMTRKAALEALEKENKILENRFARLEVWVKEKERERVKSGLDKQIKEIERIRKEKEKEFDRVLNRAEEDKAYCEELLERHKSEGLDYLNPHPNWKLVAGFKRPDNFWRPGAGEGDVKNKH